MYSHIKILSALGHLVRPRSQAPCSQNSSYRTTMEEVRLSITEKNYGRDDQKAKQLLPKPYGSLNLTSSRLEFRGRDEGPEVSVPLAWILNVELVDEDQLIIHFVARGDDEDFYFFHFRRMSVSFPCETHRRDMLMRLEQALIPIRKLRPKKLFVILNPRAGWGQSAQVFEEVASPLLAIAGVEIERHDVAPGEDIRDILAERENLETEFDGILTAGGDGTHNAIFNGLVKRSGCQLDGENPRLPKLKIPVGILPTGSGNGTSLALNMSHDIQSCVINIILGHKRAMDLLTIHDPSRDNRFITAAHMMVQIVAVNSVAQSLEKLRFLGPFRYLVAFFFLATSKVPVFPVVQYRPIRRDPGHVCFVEEVDGKMVECPFCASIAANDETDDDVLDGELGEWQSLDREDGVRSGSVNFDALRWFLPLKGVGAAWNSSRLHLANGSLKLTLSNTLGVGNFLKFFWCWYADLTASRLFNPPQCAIDVAREARVRMAFPFPIGIDGEIQAENHQELYVKAHKCVAEGFGTGVVDGHPDVSSLNTVMKVRRIMITFLTLIAVAIVTLALGVTYVVSMITA